MSDTKTYTLTILTNDTQFSPHAHQVMSVETHHHSFIFEAEFQVQVANLRTHNDEVTML
mgnify:CR=1 FL=1